MTRRELASEVFLTVLLIVLIGSFLDPFHLWMPGKMAMVAMFGAVIVYLLFASFIWKERARDEREEMHRSMAGRMAWLAGASVLMLGLVVQGVNYAIDPWLVYALLAMVLAKVGAGVYSKYKQ